MSGRRAALGLLTALLAAGGCASDTAETAAGGAPPAGLASLWGEGLPAFGVFVPNERPPGERAADGSRLPPLYTEEGSAELARNALYDFLFLNLERGFDSTAVVTLVRGLATPDAVGEKALLVRIPPIERDGAEAAGARVRASLAAGADGVVLPHVRSAEEARTAVGFFEGEDVWSPENPDGTVFAMLMVEDPGALEEIEAIADVRGYSILACGIGSLTQALGDRDAAEAGNQQVLAHARRVGRPDMITANAEDVARRIEEGFLALLMSGDGAGAAIRVGRDAAGR